MRGISHFLSLTQEPFELLHCLADREAVEVDRVVLGPDLRKEGNANVLRERVREQIFLVSPVPGTAGI